MRTAACHLDPCFWSAFACNAKGDFAQHCSTHEHQGNTEGKQADAAGAVTDITCIVLLMIDDKCTPGRT